MQPSAHYVLCMLLQAGQGRPLIITDAFSDWPAMHKWSFDFFRQRHGSVSVRVNDRAPARHADAQPGGCGPQNTVLLPLAAYVEYVLEQRAHAAATAPFYLNGWSAISDVPSLAADCPGPAFLEGIDHTAEILHSLDKALCKPGLGGSVQAGPLLDSSSMTTRLKKALMSCIQISLLHACRSPV